MALRGDEVSAPQLPWKRTFTYGIVLVLLGSLFVVVPLAGSVIVAEFIGGYWLVAGVLNLFGARGSWTAWPLRVAAGAVGILAGLAIISHPIASAVLLPSALVVLVGGAGIAQGVLQVTAAIHERHWSAVLIGAIAIIIGTALLAEPVLAGLDAPVVIGSIAFLGGALVIATAILERRAMDEAMEEAAAPGPGQRRRGPGAPEGPGHLTGATPVPRIEPPPVRGRSRASERGDDEPSVAEEVTARAGE